LIFSYLLYILPIFCIASPLLFPHLHLSFVSSATFAAAAAAFDIAIDVVAVAAAAVADAAIVVTTTFPPPPFLILLFFLLLRPSAWSAAAAVGNLFIMFGGYAPFGVVLGDTWAGTLSKMANSAYDVVWEQAVITGANPANRFNAASAASIGLFFLHGGQGSPSGDNQNPLVCSYHFIHLHVEVLFAFALLLINDFFFVH
jgi:hypothetical protein